MITEFILTLSYSYCIIVAANGMMLAVFWIIFINLL